MSDKTENEILMDKLDLNRREVEELSKSFTELKTSVDAINTNTKDMVAMFEAGRGAFKVLGWLGAFAKWVTIITAACAVIYGLFSHDWKPPK